ncbi:MAG: hypothetical protein JRI80_19940 [Deltaproteobacteria bacterium]|nr:hypothetical protein [Deltaproteobacteria bacterium]
MTDSPKVLKTLPNGYVVPYPEELVHNGLLFLKDYRLNRYPGMETGRPADISYDDYVKWLADYLPNCDLSLIDEQKRVRDYITANAAGMGTMLGWIAGFYQSVGGMHPFYQFPEDFDENPDIEALEKAMGGYSYEEVLDLIDEDEDIPDKLSFVLEDYGWFLTMKMDVDEFLKYWPGFIPLEPIHWMVGSVGLAVERPDYAWRTYLSMLLKSTGDKAARIEHLDRFFREYNDTIHK